MLRKYLVPVLLAVQVVMFLLFAGVFVQQPAASASGVVPPQEKPQAQFTVNQYLWSYAAKFVCGYQRTATPAQQISGEPTLKPGNYATEINIHNPTYRLVPLHKRFLVLVNGQQVIREPQQVEPLITIPITMGLGTAMMDDCNNLWTIIYPGAPVPSPMPVFIGYLVILSPIDLDVDVVYTANAPGDLATAPSGVSIDVERVTGKRIFIPTGALP